MNSKLIEAGENCYFYCNNCKSKFTFIYTFLPTNNSKEYYICNNCSSILPVADIKQTRVNKFLNYFCRCFI
jgi:protein-arginine kinase activator protein McsA